MNGPVLVAYASRAGSTAEVAAAIGATLREAGLSVDVSPLREIDGLEGYQALVLGTAIRAGRLLPEATRFAKAHAAAMGQMPVVYFAVCATLREDTPTNRATVAAALDPLVAIKTPLDVGLFAGRLDHEMLEVPARWLIRLMRAAEGDWRDWDAIRAWAATLPARIEQAERGAAEAVVSPLA
jgi:menaquinone-dependent protoporphyrinogen oxidase